MPDNVIEPLSDTRPTCCIPPNVKTVPDGEELISPLATSPRVGKPLELETVGSPSNSSPLNKNPGIGTLSGLRKPPPLLSKKSTLSKADGELPSQLRNGPSI